MKVAIGRFGRPHGVRGEIRFWPYNQASELLKPKKMVTIGSSPGQIETLYLETVRFDAKSALVRFEGISDRDVVGRLTNAFWFESRESFPPLADDEFYYADLIGLKVVTADGEQVGHIKDVVDSGPAEIFVLDRDGREAMLPNVDEFVVEMDFDGGRVIVSPPEGLIDGLGNSS